MCERRAPRVVRTRGNSVMTERKPSNEVGKPGAASLPAETSGGGRRLGIGGKLLTAFGVIAALTVVAAGVAWTLFADVRDNLHIIAEDSLPELAASFRLARSSAQIGASIPHLVAADSLAELARQKIALGERVDEVIRLGALHEVHDEDIDDGTTGLQNDAEMLRSRIAELNAAVHRRLIFTQRREHLLDSLSGAHARFIKTVDPIIEAAHDAMIASTKRSVADGTSRITGLIDESFEASRGVMQIQSNVNHIVAVMQQVAGLTDRRELARKRFEIVGPIADIKNETGQVSEIEDGEAYVDLVRVILEIAIGPDGIFALKRMIGKASGADADALERSLKGRLSDLNDAHARFLDLSKRVIESVDRQVLETAANTTREGQTIVIDAEEGIGAFETLLFIHSDTNQLFGLLGKAGTAPVSADLEALRNRYEILRAQILQNLILYESAHHNPAVRTRAEEVLAYGESDNSILSTRLAELEVAENALVIHGHSQALADRLIQSANELVEKAEQAGAGAESSTLRALSRGELILVGISILSLAAALLIVWLYVFRGIVRRLMSLSDSMLSIAKGDLDTEIVFQGGNDEITDMRRALTVFRDDAFKRRQAEEALRESEQRMRLILATSPIGVGISHGESSTIVYVNNRLAELFGLPADEMVGLPVERLYADPVDRQRLLEHAAKDGSVSDAEVLSKKADGTQFWSLLSFYPIEYGGQSARLGWIYDITERKRTEVELRESKERAEKALSDLKAAQERLVQTEKMASLGQLTAGVAHEIKNPLNFVMNFSDISVELLEELKENLDSAIEKLETGQRDAMLDQFATIEDMLEKIKAHGDRANNIVKNMLAHTREGPAKTRLADLNALLEESLDLAYHAARAEDQSFNVTLERSFDPDVGELELYPADLMRVFLNLVGNAFYATRKRGAGAADGYVPSVSVSTLSRDGKVEVRVRDNGIGIPKSVKDKIFDPFFTTKPPGEGTGLGLSLSYETIVQQHKGWMEVSSEEGAFTEFLVTLPR